MVNSHHSYQVHPDDPDRFDYITYAMGEGWTFNIIDRFLNTTCLHGPTYPNRSEAVLAAEAELRATAIRAQTYTATPLSWD